jgi:signal transduction histidine kinase
MSAHRPTVLILSSDPAFARELSAYWPHDAVAPEFTVLEGDLFRDLIGSEYDLAVAEASTADAHSALKQALLSATQPAILVCKAAANSSRRRSSEKSAHSLPPDESAVIELYRRESNREGESWAVAAGLLGREILRRLRADGRARQAEAEFAAAQAEATLGRFMVEMRHNMNNALTSVLGNAELLTLEPGLPANAIAQADTIRNMALRMHEIFQRFSSIEKELSVVARESDKKAPLVRAAAAH